METEYKDEKDLEIKTQSNVNEQFKHLTGQKVHKP